MKKRILIPGILILLIIGLHLIAGYLVSQKLEQQLSNSFLLDSSEEVSIDDVSVYPFRGNVYLVNFRFTPVGKQFQFSAGSIGSDLSYWQFWSLLLQGTDAITESLTSFIINGHDLEWKRKGSTSNINEAVITITPSRQGIQSNRQNLWEKIRSSSDIQGELYEVSLDIPQKSSEFSEGRVSPHPIVINSIYFDAAWNQEQNTLNVNKVSLNSPGIEGESSGIIKLSGSGFRVANWTHDLTFNDKFSINFKNSSGAFKGQNLTSRHSEPAGTGFSSPGRSLARGKHMIKLENFTWVPSVQTQKKIESLTGGLGLPADTLNGENLLIEYTYNLVGEKLNLQNFSFKAPAFSCKVQATVLVDEKNLHSSYIQNGEIKIHKLSDQLRSTIQQFEEFFGTEILDPASQSIRIYIQGNLNEPDWKLM